MSDKNTAPTPEQELQKLKAELQRASSRADKAEAALATAKQGSASTATLRDQVKDLTKQLAAREATMPKNSNPLVTLDGEIFEVVGGERTANGVCTKHDLAKDIARCKALRDLKSGLLRVPGTKNK